MPYKDDLPQGDQRVGCMTCLLVLMFAFMVDALALYAIRQVAGWLLGWE